jgi:hypothetical protein
MISYAKKKPTNLPIPITKYVRTTQKIILPSHNKLTDISSPTPHRI